MTQIININNSNLFTDTEFDITRYKLMGCSY